MRLIDALELKRSIACSSILEDGKTLEQIIDELPTIEERKTGRWILSDTQRQEDVDNGNYQFICSECGKADIHSKAVAVSFCWNCGARMEGEG